MRNPLTIHIESYLGSIFISLLAAFFVGLMFIAMKNFDSDINSLNAVQTKLRIETSPVPITEN